MANLGEELGDEGLIGGERNEETNSAGSLVEDEGHGPMVMMRDTRHMEVLNRYMSAEGNKYLHRRARSFNK
jgi:hypothetical protein